MALTKTYIPEVVRENEVPIDICNEKLGKQFKNSHAVDEFLVDEIYILKLRYLNTSTFRLTNSVIRYIKLLILSVYTTHKIFNAEKYKQKRRECSFVQ